MKSSRFIVTTTCMSALILAAGQALAQGQCSPSIIDGGADTYVLDSFGASIAIDGNTMVVGEPSHNFPGATDAAAIVFTRLAAGFPWIRSQLISEGGGAATASNFFGKAVDIDAGTIVVGAPSEAVNSLAGAGVVRIFQKAFGSWINVGTIANPFPAAADNFGFDVAISGDDLLIGAPGDDSAGPEKGVIYFYHKTNGAWTRIDRITFPSLNNGARFGEVLDMCGNTAVIGVPRAASFFDTNVGGAFIYRKGNDGHWFWEDTLEGSFNEGRVGAAVAVGPHTITWSTPGQDNPSPSTGQGSVLTIYSPDPSNPYQAWTQASLHGMWPDNLPSVTGFGSSLAVDGDRILVGTSGGPFRAFLYSGYGDAFEMRMPTPVGGSASFGGTLGLGGSSILVGDSGATARGFAAAGEIFEYSQDPWRGTDRCEDAHLLVYGSFAGCTATASPSEGLTGLCGSSASSPDVWFRVMTSPSRDLVLDTESSSFDTVLSVHADCAGGAAAVCDDDGGTGTLSRLVLPAEASRIYLVRVSGFNGASGGFVLNVRPGCGIADFNGDGDIGTDADIEAFFACLAGSCCPTCAGADFNADGDVGTDADIESFFRVLAGGSC